MNFIKIFGIIVLIIAIPLLFINNLFIRFLSTTIILINIFVFIYYIYLFFYYKKNKLEITSFSDHLLLPFKENRLEITGKNLPFLFPGIYNKIYFEIYDKDLLLKKENRIIELVEKNRFVFNYSFDKHGEFTVKNIKIANKDIFGFSHFFIKSEYSTIIKILPFFKEEIKLPIYMDKGGDLVIQKIIKENSTDFFENRKYFPGDDPRKINWKILAHTGELQIREVEKIPPKAGEISIVFAPYSSNLYEYEYISSLFLSTVYFLLENKFVVKILSPSSNNFIKIDSQNKNELDNILNNSYYTLSYDIKNLVSYPIIFASYEEFDKLINLYDLKNSFVAISFYNIEYEKSLFKNIFFIQNFDNTFVEIFNLIKLKKLKNEREKRLKELINIAEANKIFLEIYRANDEEFRE